MVFGRRKDVPKDKREYRETYELGYRLDYLLAVVLAFIGFLYFIYKTEIEGLMKNVSVFD